MPATGVVVSGKSVHVELSRSGYDGFCAHSVMTEFPGEEGVCCTVCYWVSCEGKGPLISECMCDAGVVAFGSLCGRMSSPEDAGNSAVNESPVEGGPLLCDFDVVVREASGGTEWSV